MLSVTTKVLSTPVAPGESTTMTVTFSNDGEDPITLLIERPSSSGSFLGSDDDTLGYGGLGLAGIGSGGGGTGEGIGLGNIGTLGHGPGTGSGAGSSAGSSPNGIGRGSPSPGATSSSPPGKTSPALAPSPTASASSSPASAPAPDSAPLAKRDDPTPGFHTSAATPKGQSVEMPGGFGILGMLGSGGVERSYTQITIAPHGKAEARVAWKAVGYDPAKSYAPKHTGRSASEGFMLPPPEPLPIGEYDVTVSIPQIRYAAGTWSPPPQKARVRVAR